MSDGGVRHCLNAQHDDFFCSVAAVTPGHRVEEALPLVREVLTLLNTNTNSVLPHLTRDVLDRWIR